MNLTEAITLRRGLPLRRGNVRLQRGTAPEDPDEQESSMVLFALLVFLAADPAPPTPIPPEFVEYFEREKAATESYRKDLAIRIADLDAKWEAEPKPEVKLELRKKRSELQKSWNRLDTKTTKFPPDLTKKGSIGWIREAEIANFVDETTAVMMGHETNNDIFVLLNVSPRDLRIGRKPDFRYPWQVIEVEQRISASPKWERKGISKGLLQRSGTFCVLKPIPIQDLDRYRKIAKESGIGE